MKTSAGIIVYINSRSAEPLVLLGDSTSSPYQKAPSNNRWTFPKGEFDPNIETPEDAALREFAEETSVDISKHKSLLVAKTPFVNATNTKTLFPFLLNLRETQDPALYASLLAVHKLHSNTCEVVFNNVKVSIPELFCFRWMPVSLASAYVNKSQRAFFNDLANELIKSIP